MNLKIFPRIGVFFMLFVATISLSPAKIARKKRRNYDLPEFFPYANGTYPNATLWRSPWALYNTKSNNTWDPFNATVHRINDTNAPYWKTPPYYYDGESIFDGEETKECLYWQNTSNGTNCSFVYGGPYFQSVYSESTPKCHTSLMQSYGLSGFPVSESQPNSLCPRIINSCCSRKDFLEAYQTWTKDGLENEIDNKLSFYTNTYLEFLNSLQKASDTAIMIGQKINGTNNCKVLANSISQFDVINANGQLFGLVRRTFKYFESSYKSFFCAICDGDNHKYFDLSRQRVNFSYIHCRDVVENTLPFLMYFHMYYTRLSNLLVDFTSYCDGEGVFKKIHLDESIFRLQIDKEISRELYQCKKQRNSKHWFKACLPICERINLTELDQFFLPNLKKMGSISSLITGNLKIIRKQYLKKIADKEMEVDKSENVRILAENFHKKTKEEKSQRNLQQSFPTSSNNYQIIRNLKLEDHDYTMIPGAIDQTVNCDKLKPSFERQGIRIEDIVSQTGWSETGYLSAVENFYSNNTFNNKNLTRHIAQITGSVAVKRIGYKTFLQKLVDLINE